MLTRILRQYRRFFLGCSILFAIILLGVAYGMVEWPEIGHGPVITVLAWTLLMVMLIGAPVVGLAILLPGLLPLVELWGITLLLVAALDPVTRLLKSATTLPGWVYCFILLALFIIVERCLYGPWLEGVLHRDMKRQSATFRVRGTPETLWRALVPDPEHSGRYFWPDACFLPAPKDSDADFILNLPRRRGYKDALLAIHVENALPYATMRYRAIPLPGSGDPVHVVDIAITPLDDQTSHVTYAHQYLAVPLGKRLFYYLNHDFLDTLASQRARLGGRRDWSLQGAQMLRG